MKSETTIRQDFKSLLLSSTLIADMTDRGDRIYHQQMPQDVLYPSIVFHVTSREVVTTLDGPTALENAIFQCVCMSLKTGDAEQMVGAIKNFGGRDLTRLFYWIFHADSADEIDRPAVASEKAARLLSTSLKVWF